MRLLYVRAMARQGQQCGDAAQLDVRRTASRASSGFLLLTQPRGQDAFLRERLSIWSGQRVPLFRLHSAPRKCDPRHNFEPRLPHHGSLASRDRMQEGEEDNELWCDGSRRKGVDDQQAPGLRNLDRRSTRGAQFLDARLREPLVDATGLRCRAVGSGASSSRIQSRPYHAYRLSAQRSALSSIESRGVLPCSYLLT